MNPARAENAAHDEKTAADETSNVMPGIHFRNETERKERKKSEVRREG